MCIYHWTFYWIIVCFSLINDDVAELFFSEFDDGYFCQVCSGCSHDDEPLVSDRRDTNASCPSSDSLINLRGVFKCGVSRDNWCARWARDKHALIYTCVGYTSVGDIKIERYIQCWSNDFWSRPQNTCVERVISHYASDIIRSFNQIKLQIIYGSVMDLARKGRIHISSRHR